jgi:hypothetical protein
MKSYKGWTGEERTRSLKKTNEAIRKGIILPAKKCNRCGQEEGIIHYHNHDYSDPIKHLEPLCWRCHMILHSEHRAPEACRSYWEAIAAGKRFPPVLKSNLLILRKDHGID